MIRPMSYRVRIAYLILGVVFFAVSVPLIIMYALGYRFGDNWMSLRETGGVYVWAGNAQTDVLIDGTVMDRTGFLGRSAFIQNLDPGSYTVMTQKEGYRNWSQQVEVYGAMVTEVNALLVKNQNRLKLLSVGTTTQDVQVNDVIIAYRPQVDIAYIWDLLAEQQRTATSSPRTMLRATSTPITSSMYSIFRQGTSTLGYMPCVAGEYTGVRSLRPKPPASTLVQSASMALVDVSVAPFQRNGPIECITSVLFDAETEPVVWFDFYPGRDDVLLVRTTNDLFAVEITNTSPRHVYRLYSGPGQVVTDGRQIYAATAEQLLYEIEL